MTGKEKCRLLRQIRSEIAQANGIAYVTEECTYQGDDCLGTCPKCDAEVRQLEMALSLKAARGEQISLQGLCEPMMDHFLENRIPEKEDRDKYPISPDEHWGRETGVIKKNEPDDESDVIIPEDWEFEAGYMEMHDPEDDKPELPPPFPPPVPWNHMPGYMVKNDPEDPPHKQDLGFNIPEFIPDSSRGDPPVIPGNPPEFRGPGLSGYVQDYGSFEKDVERAAREEIIRIIHAETQSPFLNNPLTTPNLLLAHIESLGLSPYINNTLEAAGIQTIMALINRSESEVLRMFSDRASALQLIRKVNHLGFRFAPDWNGPHLMGVMR